MTALPTQLQSIVTANNKVYRTPLPDDSIRIMKLYPSCEEDDRIVCSLSVVQFQQVQPFHALSYCWGAEQDERAICCNGQPFKVTRNLYAALEHLRLQAEVRYLWIDALCINQDSNEERNKHVPIMAQIYKNARRVVVWLGEEDESTGLALEAMHEIWRACCANVDVTEEHNDRFEARQNDERSWQILRARITSVRPTRWLQESDAFSHALQRFFHRSWFSRIWVIQEVRGCSDILVHIGKQTVAWNLIALAAAWVVYAPSPITRIKEPYKFGGFLHADLMRQRLFITLDDVPFLEVLDRCRSFKSTIDKDRIFALLHHQVARSHPNDNEYESEAMVFNPRSKDSDCLGSHFNLKVDYNATLLQLYRQVVLGSITEGSSLQVLTYAHEDLVHRKGYPSWMPVWHHTSSRFTGPHRTFLYNASRGSRSCISILPDPALLGLHGLICGKVEETSVNIEFCSKTRGHVKGGIHYGTSISEIWEISRLIVRDCWQPEDNWFQELMCRVDSQLDRHFQDFCAFMSEKVQDRSDRLLLSLHGKWCDICMKRHTVSPVIDVAETLHILHCETCFDFDVCLSCYGAGYTCPEAHELSPRAIPSMICQLDEQTRLVFNGGKDGGSSRRFDLGVRQTFDGKSFFRLDTGVFGIGPNVSQPGDMIVIFFGSRVPFVLRQQGNSYTIVGECYVQGMMDGEAVIANQASKFEEQMFIVA